MGWIDDCVVGESSCYDTQKTGKNILTGLIIDVIIGALCLLGFVVWRGRFKIYYGRLVLPNVRSRPPPMQLGGHRQLWSWLVPVFHVRDAELLKTAGLDALMSIRVIRFGLLMLLPMTILGIGVVLPVNFTGGYYTVETSGATPTEGSGVNVTDGSPNSTDYLTSQFLRMTMSNIPPRSPLLWIHFVFVYIFVAWTCQLLVQYSKEYVALRQVSAVQGTRAAAKALPSSRGSSGTGAHKAAGSGQVQRPEGVSNAFRASPNAELRHRKPGSRSSPVPGGGNGHLAPPPQQSQQGVGGKSRFSPSWQPARLGTAAGAAGDPGGPGHQAVDGGKAVAAHQQPQRTSEAGAEVPVEAVLDGVRVTLSEDSYELSPVVASPGVTMVGATPVGPEAAPLEQALAHQAQQAQQAQPGPSLTNGRDPAASAPAVPTPSAHSTHTVHSSVAAGSPAYSRSSSPQRAGTTRVTVAPMSRVSAAGGSVGGSHTSGKAVSWASPEETQRLAAELFHDGAAAGAGSQQQRPRRQSTSESDEEGWQAKALRPGRYTVLVMDEGLQRFRMSPDSHFGFIRSALPSFSRKRVDPKSEKASTLADDVADKAWLQRREKSERTEHKRRQAWAEINYRMNVAGETLSTLFGDDLCSIIPVYPTKAVDELQAALYNKERCRDRLLYQLAKVEADLAAAAAATDGSTADTGKQDDGPHYQAEPHVQQQQQQLQQKGESEGQQPVRQDLETGLEPAGPEQPAGLEELPSVIQEGAREEEQQAQVKAAAAAAAAQAAAAPPLAGAAADGSGGPLEPAAQGGGSGGVTVTRLLSSHQQQHKAAQRLQRRAGKLKGRLEKAEGDVEAARQAVEGMRREVLEGPPCPSFFVTFRTQQAAMLASQLNLNPVQERLFWVQPAPEPDNVNWPTLQRGWWNRTLRMPVVAIFIVIIMLFPIGAFSGIGSQLSTTLCPAGSSSTLDASSSWFCSDNWWASLFRNVVTSWLPSLLLTIYQAVVLPIYFYTCAQAEAQHVSLSALDHRCALYFFYWNVFNFFLGALLGGSVAAGIQSLISGDAKYFFSLLGAAIAASSNFFVNYVMFRGIAMVPFQLFWPCAQVLGYILKWLHIFSWAKTPKDQALECPPRNKRYSRDVGITVMSVVMATLGYAVISPIILPFGLLFFLLAWVVWRYQALYVYEPAYDSYGQIWTYAAHRYVGCLVIMAVFTAAMLGVKGSYTAALIMLFTLVPYLTLFNRYLTQRYDAVVAQLPVITTVGAERICIDPTTYAPPPLQEHGKGWHLDWGKAWQYWGVPRYGL